jgi:hypothetical protein
MACLQDDSTTAANLEKLASQATEFVQKRKKAIFEALEHFGMVR